MVSDKDIFNLQKKQSMIIRNLTKKLSLIINGQMGEIEATNTLTEIQGLINVNIFMKTSNMDVMKEFYNLIDRAFRVGIDFSPGPTSKDLIRLSEMVQENIGSFVSKLGEDIKQEALDIVSLGLENGLLPQDIKLELVDMLGKKDWEAERIARTETMRASNAGAYNQALSDGCTHFVIDNRAEACSECQDEYEGQVFELSEQDAIPPLHPNCACVPVFFHEQGEAQGWSDDLQSEKQDIRDELEKDGKEISKDGTSRYTNN